MKILVIGGAGSAGTSLVKRLLEKDMDVSILDIVAKAETEFRDLNIPYHWMSVQDIKPDDIKDYETIIYLAAQADAPLGYKAPMWTCYQNVYGALNFFENARYCDRIGRILVATSGTEYGNHQYIPIDEDHPLMPANPYAWSKASQEMAAMMYYRCYSLPISIMGNGVIVGPGMRKEIFLYKWLYNLLQNKPVILEGGEQTRDVTYITDALDAWELMIDAPVEMIAGQKFQVSYGAEYSIKSLLDICIKECDVSRDLIIPAPYRFGEENLRECFNISKAESELGYKPKVSPRESVRLTANWIRNEILHRA